MTSSVLLFPGQGSQSVGMGKDLYDNHTESHRLFAEADEVLGFPLSQIMFEGTDEDLKQTKVTQPAVFLNSIIRYKLQQKDITPLAVAGHSLGEFTALVAADVLSLEDGISLVSQRSLAMQEACDNTEGTMAAILGLDDEVVEGICADAAGVVVAANYNCPGQLVISGEVKAIEQCAESAKEQGARRAIVLPVNGAFHSPLMESAKVTLQKAIEKTSFNNPLAPIYQNVNGQAVTDVAQIKSNLIQQLTSPVRWTQTMKNMLADGHKGYMEFGSKVLSGFMRRVDRTIDIQNV